MQHSAFQSLISSYYHNSVNPHDKYPKLSGHLKVKTCVIGGGLSGVCTALPLAENSNDVALIESVRIGYGASGRSGGQVLSDYCCGMEAMEKQVGLEQAKWFWQQSLDAVELVDERVKKHQIDCDWQRGTAVVAIRPHHLEELERWQQKAVKDYNAQHMQMWDKQTLRQELASDRYLGGVYDPLSGHLHPLNYTIGVAQAAEKAGTQIFEDSPFVKMEHHQNGWLVHTPEGSIECKNVVLAVNTFISTNRDKIFRQLNRKIIPVANFIIATEPLGERAKELIPNNIAYCDSRRILDYYRLSADGRLLFGGKDSEFPQSNQRITRALRKEMLKVFPQLEDVRIDYMWQGDCDVSVNLMPHFGRKENNLYYLQAYSGHGMAITGIAGLAVSEAIMGDDRRLASFEKLRLFSIPCGTFVRQMASFIVSVYYRIQDAR